MVGGPGFGKTSLLVSAIGDDVGRRVGDRDVWLSCTSDDADAESLLAGLGAALGVERVPDLEAVLRAVWVTAPAHTCLVLDDVHEVPPDSGGAALLARLVGELPTNGHVVLASRAAPPFAVAGLAAQGRLERITEDDLLFDEPEQSSFAASRHVDVSVLESSGGWPALAELAATAAEDLVLEYVWDEVLAKIGTDRSRQLAFAAIVGGVDDDVAKAALPGAPAAADLARGVPLVESSPDGWVTPHALWRPALRRLLTDGEVADARRRAAEVHRRAGRLDRALALFAEAGDWDEALATMRLAGLDPFAHETSHRFGAWYQLLPDPVRSHPAAVYAAGIEVLRRVPIDAQPLLQAAADGFAALGDPEGEVAALMQLGLVAWWSNDGATILALTQRARSLADAGWAPADVLARIGEAGIAHVLGDADGVLAALVPVDARSAGPWHSTVAWLRHVAHRHRGDLDRAEAELDSVTTGRVGTDAQHEMARLRTEWLRGRVDQVPDRTRAVAESYRAAGRRYLEVESTLELAARLAWLGEVAEARRLLDEVAPSLPGTPGALAVILRCIAEAAAAVNDGDEAQAQRLLAAEPLTRPGRAESWYWVDRTAAALGHVLTPEHREAWEQEAAAPAHRLGVVLARALEAARDGDLAPVAALTWPSTGLPRAHLPARWLVELVAAAHAAGNPPPAPLVEAIGDPMAPALEGLAGDGPVPYAAAAAHLRDRLTPARRAVVAVRVLGPLEVWRDDERASHPHLRRQRVRELLAFLVAHRTARREVVADALWPDHPDPRHNLRVTLGYLHDVLDPGRRPGQPSPHLEADQRTIALVASDRFRCDLWDLEAHLAAGAAAERSGDPVGALAAYDAALPLWRGDPFDDVAAATWAADQQGHLRARFTAAALRTGELHLAGGSPRAAAGAASAMLAADRYDERAHQLVVRAHLAEGDRRGAQRALDAALAVVAELGVRPDDETLALARTIAEAADSR